MKGRIKKTVVVPFVFQLIVGIAFAADAIDQRETIPVELVEFPVSINQEEYNVINYNSNNMLLCEYPIVMYKDIVYIPLTYHTGVLLGMAIKLDDNKLFLTKIDFDKPAEYIRDQSAEERKEKTIWMERSPFLLNIQGTDYNDEEYPALFYKNIVYLPLTWNVVNGFMQGEYVYGVNEMFSPKETGLGLYTDSYYYYSEGDAYFEIREDGSLAAAVPYGKTYYKKKDTRVFAYIELWYMSGPSQNNMDIYKGENKITVSGYTGHGQKQGPLFTVDGEYIYTVHSDHEKYAPCKIKIDTGEIVYMENIDICFDTARQNAGEQGE